jgi:predicted RecA/RadA family phage recombinase
VQGSGGAEEVLVRKKTYWEAGSFDNRSGTLILTTERILLEPPAPESGAFGPLGVLLAARVISDAAAKRRGQTKPNLFEIPLDQITAARHGRRELLDKDALEIDANGRTYRVNGCFKSFGDPLKHALEARGHRVEGEAEDWVVAHPVQPA